MAASTPKIKLYTNYVCPWAYRAHIALAELALPYAEEIIDLNTPRPASYLKINPRGQVPTMIIDNKTITESAIIATYLADRFPSKLLPTSSAPEGPHVRSKINYFVDAYFSRVQSFWGKVLEAKTDAEEKAAASAYVEAVSREVEALLSDAGPFFGESETLTLAEVLAGSWILRAYTLPKYEIVPTSILEDLPSKALNFDKWAREVIKHPSILCIWDEEKIVEGTRGWIGKMRGKV